VTQEATVVDDFLRNETSNAGKVMAAMAVTEGERPVTVPAHKQMQSGISPQQSLALDEPDQNPATVIDAAGKTL
jgi:sec-independent protein translocase protein TatB